MKFEFQGEKIRELAKDKGISITKLAKEVGVTRKTIYDWSDGQVPKADHFLALCFIFDVESYHFFQRII